MFLSRAAVQKFSSRYNHSVEMVPGLLGLGRALAKRLDALSRRIIYIVSSDLAHTHQASGHLVPGICNHSTTSLQDLTAFVTVPKSLTRHVGGGPAPWNRATYERRLHAITSCSV